MRIAAGDHRAGRFEEQQGLARRLRARHHARALGDVGAVVEPHAHDLGRDHRRQQGHLRRADRARRWESPLPGLRAQAREAVRVTLSDVGAAVAKVAGDEGRDHGTHHPAGYRRGSRKTSRRAPGFAPPRERVLASRFMKRTPPPSPGPLRGRYAHPEDPHPQGPPRRDRARLRGPAARRRARPGRLQGDRHRPPRGPGEDAPAGHLVHPGRADPRPARGGEVGAS